MTDPGGTGAQRPSNVIEFRRRRARARTASPTPQQATIHELLVTLSDSEPAIWRRVRVAGATRLDRLHEIIQAAMGWEDLHSHEFRFGFARYGEPHSDDEGFPRLVDERTIRLDEVAPDGTSFSYVYDFGDWWHHEITVERVVPAADDGEPVPDCTDGRRACPPEFSGGPIKYEDMTYVLRTPFHPDRRETLDWIGRPFDPETFDHRDFAGNLRRIRRARVGIHR